jgi:hypothetical protein
LAEREGRGRVALEIAADDLVARAGEVEGDGAGPIDGRGPVPAGEGEEALDAPDGAQRIVGVEGGGKLADVRADGGGPGEELQGRGRGARRAIVGMLAVLAEVLPFVFAEERAGRRVEDADRALVPLETVVPMRPGGTR